MDTRPFVKLITFDQLVLGERLRVEMDDMDDKMRSIQNLSLSLRTEGIIQPLAVQELKDDKYLILAGGRRYAALSKLEEYTTGGKKIPVRIYKGELTTHNMVAIELAENLYRKDLTWAEEVEAKNRIFQLLTGVIPPEQGPQKETAALLGESAATISQDIHLAEAIQILPELKKAKTKHEAQKTLKVMAADFARKKKATQLERKPTKAAQSQLINSYVVADFFEWAPKQKAESFDLAEVDPVYAIELPNKKRGTDKHNEKVFKALSYLECPAEEYTEFLKAAAKEVYRLLKPNAWAVWWFGPDPWFETVYKILAGVGFSLRRLPGYWVKERGQTNRPELYLANTVEMFFYCRKGEAKLNKVHNAHYEYRTVPEHIKGHDTERPIEMMTDIISTFVDEGAKIVVPFLGSGNTLLGASNHNCSAVGTELNPSHRDHYIIKVHAQEPGSYTSYAQKG